MAAQQDTNRIVEWIRQSGPVDTSKPFDLSGVAGKTILITGGASGLGAAFARRWASLGAHIILGDLNDAMGEELAAELRQSTGSEHHHFQHLNVTDWSSQVAFFRAAASLSPTGGIDCVVPNAGIGHDGTMFECPQDMEDDSPPPPSTKILDVNLTGVLYTVHLAMYWLPRNGKASLASSENGSAAANGHVEGKANVHANGHANGQATQSGLHRTRDRQILLIGSIAGLIPLVGSTLYTASKHAVSGVFRALRGTAFRQGVRVNMLCPYFVDTPMLASPVLAVLAGGGLAELDAVVDAGTRFLADESISGRALVVGPRVRVEDGPDGEPVVVEVVGGPGKRDGEGQGTAAWECYAHDYENVEAFVYRYTRLLNGVARIRGWVGWAKDLFYITFFRKTR